MLSALKSIIIAAESAKDRRQGRRGEVGKQHVADLAFGFFVRSPRMPRAGPRQVRSPHLPVHFMPHRSHAGGSDVRPDWNKHTNLPCGAHAGHEEMNANSGAP